MKQTVKGSFFNPALIALILLCAVVMSLLSRSLYPAEPQVEAIIKTAADLKRNGQYEKAYEEFARARLQTSDRQTAAMAQFQMGICLVYADRYMEALLPFQKVIDEFSDSPYAKQALDMNALLYRLYLRGNQPYTLDSSFSPFLANLDEPSGMAIDPNGNVYLSDKGKKLVYQIDATGRISSTISMLAPHHISVQPGNNRVWVANETGVVSVDNNESVSFTAPTGNPLQEIRSVAVNEEGSFFVISNKFEGIRPYDRDRKPLAGISFPLVEFVKVVANFRNQICALPKDRKTIGVFERDGRMAGLVASDDKEMRIERIEDFTVDAANHIYALTENPRGVMILTPSRKLLKWVVSLKKGPLTFEDAKLIAVSSSGAIFVMDKDTKRILKIG